MRIAVCDDEINETELTIKHIKSWAKKGEEAVEIFRFSSGAELLFHLSERSIDLAFLDIKMKNMNGIELAKILRKNDNNMIIVFITGLINYVFQGYEVQALQYLLKPVKEKDCHACLDKASELIRLRQKEIFIIKNENENIRLLYDEIYAFEIFSHYIETKSLKGLFTFKGKMGDLERKLPSNRFIRCHRSFIVNMHYVNTINKTTARMDNGICIPISKSRWDAMNKAFIEYYAKGIKV